jgi:hypothetical protein
VSTRDECSRADSWRNSFEDANEGFERISSSRVELYNTGTDVMILKNIFAKKIGDFDANYGNVGI